MKKLLLFILFLLLSNIFLLIGAKVTYANELNQVFIKPGRLKANTSPGPILITATTGESVTENAVEITVGSAWTISSNTNNFTISTANLPSSVTAWPGIGTSNNVLGNTVSFPSSDLTPNIKYGFYLIGGIALNPPAGDGGNYLWNVTTVVSGSPSSNADVMITIITNDQVVIIGEVPVSASYFDVSLVSLDSKSTFQQNEVLNFQITYSSTYAQSTPLILQAEWGQGTLQGSSTPSVNVLDYVIGSATEAYGDTPSVIDLSNKTITWAIPFFPANASDKTVTFQLKTISSYTGSTLVSFSTTSRITSPVVTADSSVAGQYSYSLPTPTPTPTPAPPSAATPTPTISTTSVSTETTTITPSAKNSFSGITISRVSTNMIGFNIGLLLATGIEANYGTSLKNLDKKIIFSNEEKYHQISFDNLEKDTLYYFQFKTRDNSPITSDIFGVRTASSDSVLELKKNTLIVTGDRNLLWDAEKNCLSAAIECLPIITIPNNSKHEFVFTIENFEKMASIYVLIKNPKILGVSTESNFILDPQTDLVEIMPGVFQARVTSPTALGQYDVIVKLKDIYGNVSSQRIIVLQVVNPIQIVDQNNNPIEHTRVHFFKYNNQSQLFEILKPNSLVEQNPLYTDSEGKIEIILPHGKYRLQVDVLGYQSITQNFQLSSSLHDSYPQVILQSEDLTVFGFVNYHTTTLKNIWTRSENLVREFTDSKRFYNVSLLIAMLLFILLLPLSLSARTHVPLLKLPKHLVNLFNKRFFTNKVVTGRVINAKNKLALAGVEILVLDVDDSRVLATTQSDKRGYFHFIASDRVVKLQLIKKGYLEMDQEIIVENIDLKNILTIKLTKDKQLSQTLIEGIKEIITKLLGLGFEIIFVISLAFAVLFGFNFGFLKTIPLLLVGFFNILFGFLYLSAHRD